MNWQHLRAFAWIRWRMARNRWRRGGKLNAVLTTIVAFALLVFTIPSFVGSILLGMYLLPQAEPTYLLFAWDAAIFGFLFVWMIELLVDVQRTETLSLSNLMHLPMSVNGAILVNYATSLARLSVVLFAPPLFGFAVGLMIAKGAGMWPGLLLTAAFFLMVSALSYQFQGWLASMMTNPRRRRTVVAGMTILFILVMQLPNLFNLYVHDHLRQVTSELKKIPQQTVQEADPHIEPTPDTPTEPDEARPPVADAPRRHHADVSRQLRKMQNTQHELLETVGQIVRIANIALPAGWLPLGIMFLGEGHITPALLCLVGMTLIAAVSLARAYQTTVRLYQGSYTAGAAHPSTRITAAAATIPAASEAHRRRPRLLEWQLPGLSEPVSAIALAGWQSLLRSPETKMMLLGPIIMGAVFCSMLMRGPNAVPMLARPMLAIGAIFMALVGTSQLMGNQFGFDRDGFRVFVLCSASRRDILLGKNLACLPLALLEAIVLVVIVQVVSPSRLDHLLALVPQFVSMYLVLCIVANLGSIYAPFQVPAGALKAAHPKLGAVLMQSAMFMIIFPLSQSPTFVPLAVEALLQHFGWMTGVPIYLILALAECGVLILLYRRLLRWQGNLFQEREQRILECVTNRAP